MELNDAQKSVVMAMRAGAELVVHRPEGGATLMEGNSAKAIEYGVWYPIEVHEMMQAMDGTPRLYCLTDKGRTATL